MAAGPALGAFGVEVGVLIQGDLVGGMLVAEDVAAVATVMTALEKAEGLMAGSTVADLGIGVELPVIALGKTGHGGEIVVVHVLQRGDEVIFGDFVEGTLSSAVVGGASAEGTAGCGVLETVGTPMSAAWRGERRRARWTVCRAECSGNVHGGLGRAELARDGQGIGNARGIIGRWRLVHGCGRPLTDGREFVLREWLVRL